MTSGPSSAAACNEKWVGFRGVCRPPDWGYKFASEPLLGPGPRVATTTRRGVYIYTTPRRGAVGCVRGEEKNNKLRIISVQRGCLHASACSRALSGAVVAAVPTEEESLARFRCLPRVELNGVAVKSVARGEVCQPDRTWHGCWDAVAVATRSRPSTCDWNERRRSCFVGVLLTVLAVVRTTPELSESTRAWLPSGV